MKQKTQFPKYIVAALSAAVADWILFVGLSFIHTPYLYAQMCARIAGGVASFAVNKYWSFKKEEKGRLLKEGRRFLLLYGVSYSLNLLFLFTFVEFFGFSKFIGKLISDTLCFVLNFLIMRHYVFNINGFEITRSIRRLIKAG